MTTDPSADPRPGASEAPALHQVAESLDSPLIILAAEDLTVIYANPAARDFFGLAMESRPSWEGMIRDRRQPLGGGLPDRAVDDALEEGGVRILDRELADDRGRRRLFQVHAIPLRDETGIRWVAEQYVDVTDRGPAGEEASYGAEILEETPDFVLILSSEARILYRNAAAQGLAADPEPSDLGTLYPGWALRKIEEEALPQARERGRWQGESAVRDREGRTVPVSQVLTAHYRPDGSIARYFTFMRDLSDRKAMERQLHHRASHDALTGLYNRLKAEDFLDHAVAWAQRYSRPLGVLIADVDRFKPLNARLGRSGGDQVLVELGRVLQGLTRRADLLARWAGKEFLMVVPDTDRAGAQALAEKVRKAVAEHDFPEGERLTVSLGVAVLESSEEAGEDLLIRAEGALNGAKEDGRDCVRTADRGSSDTPS